MAHALCVTLPGRTRTVLRSPSLEMTPDVRKGMCPARPCVEWGGCTVCLRARGSVGLLCRFWLQGAVLVSALVLRRKPQSRTAEERVCQTPSPGPGGCSYSTPGLSCQNFVLCLSRGLLRVSFD